MSFHSKSNDKKRFGPSLSLHRIANRQRSDYDPREAREKERARAAKTVNKYKKLKKRLLGPEEGAGTGAVATAQEAPRERTSDAEAPTTSKPQQHNNKRPKHIPSIERLAAKVKIEKQEELQEREERQRLANERKQKLEADLRRRKQESKVFRKKTSKGQPVMKHRIEKLLGKLM